jgi:hypothetical protein
MIEERKKERKRERGRKKERLVLLTKFCYSHLILSKCLDDSNIS